MCSQNTSFSSGAFHQHGMQIDRRRRLARRLGRRKERLHPHRAQRPARHARLFAGPVSRPDARYVRRQRGQRKSPLRLLGHDPIKDLLAVLRYNEPPIFHVHTDVPVDYQRHMNAEIKTTKRSFQTNRVTYFWRRLRKDNHLLDAECMNLLRALQLGFVPMPDEQPATIQCSLSLG